VAQLGTKANRQLRLQRTNALSSRTARNPGNSRLASQGRTELLKAEEDRDMYSRRLANFRVLRGLEIIEYK